MVTYKVSNSSVNDSIDLSDPIEWQEVYNEFKNLSFELYVKGNEATFLGQDKMEHDNNGMYLKLAKLITEYNSIYYYNFNCGTVQKGFNAYGEDISILYDISNFKWKLENEYKIIDVYKCFKASTSYMVKNEAGVFKKNVTAWYCPELNFHFGPKGFWGLPGLILELIDDKNVYYISKLQFKDIQRNVIVPEGMLITENELENMGFKVRVRREMEYKKQQGR